MGRRLAVALALPDVEVGTAYSAPALRVRGVFMARRREDGETLAIRCDIDERPLLVDAHGDAFVTPRCEAWPMVLVALPQADRTLVAELVEDAWILTTPKTLVRRYLAERER